MSKDIGISLSIEGYTIYGLLNLSGIMYSGKTYRDIISFCKVALVSLSGQPYTCMCWEELDIDNTNIRYDVIGRVMFNYAHHKVNIRDLLITNNSLKAYRGDTYIEKLYNLVSNYFIGELKKEYSNEEYSGTNENNSDINIGNEIQVIHNYVQNYNGILSPEQKINIAAKLTTINNMLLN